MVVNGHGTGLFLAYGRCGTTCEMNKTRLEDARSIDSSSEEDVEREAVSIHIKGNGVSRIPALHSATHATQRIAAQVEYQITIVRAPVRAVAKTVFNMHEPTLP